MKIVLFCEGWTESTALPDLIRRHLNAEWPQKVGIQPVRFNGWAELVKESPKKAELHLARPDVIAVVALLDLYGPSIFPSHCVTVEQRYRWGCKELEKRVNDVRFRQYFAVHEVEAWILSQPELLPREVRDRLPSKIKDPEIINFNEPPSHLLERLYREATKRSYKKRTYGDNLFRGLDANVVRAKCPYFREFTDDLVNLARKAIS